MAGKLTPEAIMAEVDSVMSARWEWGVSDCCMSVADVLFSLTGIDLAKRYRGTYSTAIGAARLIRKWDGFGGMAQHLAIENGMEMCGAIPGAIGVSARGIANGPEGRAMLICVQPGIWAGKSLDGYVILSEAEKSWCVSSY